MARASTSYGQFHVAEAPSALLSLHQHAGGPLKTVDWEPKLGVLDQEDLFAQGIDTAYLIPGAQKVDALGSCTANATTVAMSNTPNFEAYCQALLGKQIDFTDVVDAERVAIRFYHQCTDQTGTPDQEWPPSDCGSSGPYIMSELETLKVISGQQIAHGAQNIVSLLQTGGVLEGGPFLNAWEEPDASGMVDGNGSTITLEEQIKQGVAGGHETFQSAIETLALSATGAVLPEKTVLRVRNSWSSSWGDAGSFYIHLSTLVALGSYFDFRQVSTTVPPVGRLPA